MAAGISTLVVDGLSITVQRKAVRNLYLRLQRDGSIQLTAPRRVDDEALRQFIRAKWSWLEKHRSLRGDYVPHYLSGERFPLWGDYLPLEVTRTPGGAVCMEQGGALHLHLPDGAEPQQAEAALDGFYRAALAVALPAIVAEQETSMGLHATTWQLRNMTSRWGSCTPRTGAIRLNLQLARFPLSCLRYLVTHELAHLRIKGHDAAFYALVAAHQPDWQAQRARLRQGAPVLPPAETDLRHTL